MKKIVLFLIFALTFILLNQQGHTFETENNEVSAKPILMAAYIKFDSVDGESGDSAHTGWSDVIRHEHLKAGPNRRLEIMNVVMKSDKSSPLLARAFRNKKVFGNVMVDVVNTRTSYLRYELKNVLITSLRKGGTRNAPTDDFSLNFEEIKVTYVENDAAGKRATDLRYTWKKTISPRVP